jgi:hypothetical protein
MPVCVFQVLEHNCAISLQELTKSILKVICNKINAAMEDANI